MSSEGSEKVHSCRAESLGKHSLIREKDENLGRYLDIYSAKSEVKGQDGGVVTALLQKGFHDGLFDAAVVVRRISGYNAEVFVAQNPEEALATKGTCYQKVNVTKKLRELIKTGKKRVAIVCTPCEARVARRIQQSIGKEYDVTIIGLFCFEAFDPNRLKAEVKARLDIDLDNAEKIQIRNGEFLVTVNGKEYRCRVKDLDDAVEKSCRFCSDFTSKAADISVGSVGSKIGYSTVIVRSKKGEKLHSKNLLTRGAVAKEEVVRVAELKKRRYERSIEKLKQH